MKLVQASHSDLEAVRMLFADCIKSVCQNDYTPAQLKAWANGSENIKRWEHAIENQYFLLAKKGNVLVGFGSLSDYQLVDFLYVHKDLQHLGIATQIYKRLEQQAHDVGATYLKAQVSKTAKGFFLKQGFKCQKTNTLIVRGVSMINYTMHKPLVNYLL